MYLSSIVLSYRKKILDILNQDYVCLNAAGYEYLRKARTVGELPWSMRAEAQNLISKVIGLKVLFGVPFHVSTTIKLYACV